MRGNAEGAGGPSMSDAQAYYDGLIGQNYAPDQALQFTQQHFPDFQPEAAAPAPAPEPAPAPAPAPAPEPAAAAAPAGAPPMAAEPAAAVPMGAAPMGAAPMGGAPAAEAPAAAAPAADGGDDGGGLVDMLFKFDGRIGRKQWWICGIVTGIVVMVVNMVIQLIAGFTVDALSYLTYIPFLAMLWILIALDVKRLRDRGKDSILMFVLPIVIIPWGIVECGFLPSKD